ncbi:hypothetical protein Fmac_019185 [Flemingia macrophylla]|uniref:Leucine-rich repeat domain, L domain-containing protein n=1 Tax=Flemingia macrophylla TaxID=520843 RepID=A0ABD1M741_9FABA
MQNFSNLKRVDLSNSKYLIKTPNFSGMPKLERLDLSGCTIMHLSGCTKLKIMPDFKSATYLEYLDIDGCSRLSMVDESVGSLSKLTFFSLRNCINLVSIPNTINTMTSLQTLDLCGCLTLTNFPLGQTLISSSHLKSLIVLDLSFCNLLEVPAAIRMLWSLPELPVGIAYQQDNILKQYLGLEPNHFRCGFDLVVPYDFMGSPFRYKHVFDGSYARIVDRFSEIDNWIGFVFGVAFEDNNNHEVFRSPFKNESEHPFYLSFESEFTEEYFDMPLNLEGVKFCDVAESKSSSGPKIRLPYNWLVTDEDEVEIINSKAKGKDLSYAGL